MISDGQGHCLARYGSQVLAECIEQGDCSCNDNEQYDFFEGLCFVGRIYGEYDSVNYQFHKIERCQGEYALDDLQRKICKVPAWTCLPDQADSPVNPEGQEYFVFYGCAHKIEKIINFTQ